MEYLLRDTYSEKLELARMRSEQGSKHRPTGIAEHRRLFLYLIYCSHLLTCFAVIPTVPTISFR